VISGNRVARGVASATDFPEELRNLARQNPLVLELAEEIVLRFLWGGEEADPGSNKLRGSRRTGGA
jgi:hypothetical protein